MFLQSFISYNNIIFLHNLSFFHSHNFLYMFNFLHNMSFKIVSLKAKYNCSYGLEDKIDNLLVLIKKMV